MNELPKLADLDDFITGEHEYITVAKPSTKEEMEMVADAYRRGVESERKRILSDLEAETTYETLSIALFKLRNIINNKEGLSS